MNKEIERKFLVDPARWIKPTEGLKIRQGYLSENKERVVRVRTINQKAFITVKGITENIERSEFEYEIPFSDASIMLDQLCIKPLIEKTRYVECGEDGKRWEIDEFFGENAGLIVAEIELSSETECFKKPDWIKAEVSQDSRYFNSNLAKHPFSAW